MNLILTTPVSFAQKTLAHRREGEGGEGERERLGLAWTFEISKLTPETHLLS